ncbi:uncharacterized protein SPAPADRAFT_56891 [Spathaspora passalidarum NRRL Y-27907]|uniref:Uncharacterized protein n=1 Tax=Spathaspora passalidarum (strain NRRL Y-27907 / 11-Y1) TaxID=619300 RepID=G3ATI9_SPAPN|nr:uncharacterized protein SPAPADRAFT_56891 [Spathaspora passalidarum NRRL Y-27907]EGW30952.1 hypothetical protein SPAPADRAFT_56891 [Spathaspora passalidarum NRRL Y-27907]
MQQANVGFFSKIKENYSTKFSNLSLTSGHTEKDGSSDDSTLIHNSLVKYYDSKGLPYPEWLGVKVSAQPRNSQSQGHPQGHAQGQFHPHSQPQPQSQFQPIRHNNSYNNSYSQQQQQQQQHQQHQHLYTERTPSPNETTSYRSSSRLQDMYNKSRQQSLPGSTYKQTAAG